MSSLSESVAEMEAKLQHYRALCDELGSEVDALRNEVERLNIKAEATISTLPTPAFGMRMEVLHAGVWSPCSLWYPSDSMTEWQYIVPSRDWGGQPYTPTYFRTPQETP